MKRLAQLLLLVVVSLISCRETWTIGTKNRFYESCTTEAIGIDSNEQRVQQFCDCVFEKMKKKYEHEDDAMQHLGDLALDPDMQSCRAILNPVK